MALGKLYSPRAPLEEENVNALLSISYLENPEKGHHKSALTQQNTTAIIKRGRFKGVFSPHAVS